MPTYNINKRTLTEISEIPIDLERYIQSSLTKNEINELQDFLNNSTYSKLIDHIQELVSKS